MVNRHQPWIFHDLFQELDSVFGRGLGLRAVQPAELKVDGSDAVVRIDLPGVAPEDVAVDLDQGELTVRGERKPSPGDEEEIVAQERPMGVVERSVRLPWMVDPTATEAELKHGVLTIRLRKAPELEPRRIDVQVNNEAV